MSKRCTQFEEQKAGNRTARKTGTQTAKPTDPSSKVQCERPLLLPVPNYKCRRSTKSKHKAKKVDIETNNDADLRTASKDHFAWHCKQIPTERRRVRSLPTLVWNSNEEAPPVERTLQIEELDQAEMFQQTTEIPVHVTRPLRKVALSIPLETKKRKNVEVENLSRHLRESTKDVVNEAPPKQCKYELISSTRSSCSLSSPSATPVSVSTSLLSSTSSPTMMLRASSVQEREPSLPQVDRCNSNEAFQSKVVNERSSSPLMEIVSVRSLAHKTTPTLDEPLGERLLIPFSDEHFSGGSRSPLYIFNPAFQNQPEDIDNQNQPSPLESNRSQFPIQTTTDSSLMDFKKKIDNVTTRKKTEDPNTKSRLHSVNDDATSLVNDASRRALLNIFEDDFVPMITVKQEPTSPEIDGCKSVFLENSCSKITKARTELETAKPTGSDDDDDDDDDDDSSALGEMGLRTETEVSGSLRHSSQIKTRMIGNSRKTVGRQQTYATTDEQDSCNNPLTSNRFKIQSFIDESQSSPFEDSDHSDVSFEDFEVLDGPLVAESYSKNIIENPHTKDYVLHVDAEVNQFESDHCYSKLGSGKISFPGATDATQCDSVEKRTNDSHSSRAATKTASYRVVVDRLGSAQTPVVAASLPLLRLRMSTVKTHGRSRSTTRATGPLSQFSEVRRGSHSLGSKSSSTDTSGMSNASDDSGQPRVIVSRRARRASERGASTCAGHVIVKQTTPPRRRRRRRQQQQQQRRRYRDLRQKAIESMIVLKKMQLMSSKDDLQAQRKPKDFNKLSFLNELCDYFQRHEFSKEPLNRSILNAIADWLSPGPQGELPTLKLREALLDLLRQFTLTTPVHVFQSSSIEGVLKLLLSHPKECLRNKSLESAILNSWKSD